MNRLIMGMIDYFRRRHALGRNLECLALILLALLLATATGSALAQGKSHESQKNKKWNLRRVERLKDYKDETGKVRPELWEQGMAQFRQAEFAAGVNRFSPDTRSLLSPVQGVQWIQVGPQPAFPIEGINFQGNGAMSGEVLDVAIDPRNTSDTVIYSVTNDGGVWRSMDGGVTFEPKTDNMPSLSMGALALDPVNPSIVYAGTGNLFDGNGGMTTLAVKAVGVYRSVDMGETWTVLNPGGIFSGRGIARMAAPAGDVLLVGTPAGLFKSVNGGVDFGNNAPLHTNGLPVLNGDVEDIDLDPNDPSNTIYASVNGGGIFMSTDGGNTFPTNLFTATNGSPLDASGVSNGAFRFVRMAQGVSDTQRMYANVQESGNPDGDSDSFLGLYRSDDGGATWTRMPAADPAGAANGDCQCGYDQTVGVDPRDEDRVYIGFQELYISTDGGNSFAGTPISRNKIHWDHHYIGWSPPTHWGGLNPGDPTPMWVGTDGGIHSTSDGGTTFNNFHNSTIASNLFHHIDIGRGSAANNQWTYGGTQDTGTLHSCAPGGHCGGPASGSGPVPWEMGNNGDGSGTTVDPSNPLRAYSVRNGGYRFTNDGGKTWQAPNPNNTPVPSGAWRYAVDPNDTTRVWAVTGGTFNPTTGLWRSNDGSGTNWSSITNFPVAPYDLEVAAADSDVLYLGMTNGSVRKSTNATDPNPTFQTINVNGATNQTIGSVAINPLNPDDVVVTYRGLCGGSCPDPDDRFKRVFRTTDGGSSWTDIGGTDGNPSGNLPNLPTHSAVFDIGTSPPTIIVSNDAGVMRTANGGATWERLGLGLPTADSKMLQIDDSVEPPLLRLGTYGRSVWELAEAQGPILAVNTDLGFDAVCIGERQTRVVQLFNVGSEDLVVNAIFRASGSTQFSVLAGPGTPFTIAPGEEVDFTVEFLAGEEGDHTAIFQINSTDQFEPSLQLPASGTVNTQMISTIIADAGSFGNVCLTNDSHDLDLIIANPGCGLLEVSDIDIVGGDSSDFDLAGIMNFPIQISEGNSVTVPIRFDPSGATATCQSDPTRSSTINIDSNDPDTPSKDIAISGAVPCPDLNLAIANSGDFGSVCKNESAELDLELLNQGQCELTITGIGSTNPVFEMPDDLTFPLVLDGGTNFTVPVRFAPTACDDNGENGSITVLNDSPTDQPTFVSVSGTAPCPNLVIDPGAFTGDFAFPATVANSAEGLPGCFSDRSTSLRNTGDCPLTINDIQATGDEFTVLEPTSFPIVLPPGEETLGVTVRFAPSPGGDPLLPEETLGLLSISADDGASGDANLCGEAVEQSGIRTLVTDVTAGFPELVEEVDSMTVKSKGKKTPSPVNLQFTDVGWSSASVCGNTVYYHLNIEDLPATNTTGQNGKSQYETKAMEGNLQATETFDLGQCEFREYELQLLSTDGGGGSCPDLPKGASCTNDAECCSGKCKGPSGNKTCK